ncbi:MAG: polysaccharide biosynthesis/export family protein [Cyanobacteria bacterium P01_D01_bin.1]
MKSIFQPLSIECIDAVKCLSTVLVVCSLGTTISSQSALAESTSGTKQATPILQSSQEDTLPTLPSSSSAPTSSLSVPATVPSSNPVGTDVSVSVPTAAPGSFAGWESNYVLGPGDGIRIEVYGAPEYGGDFTLLSDGTIGLPVTGQIALSGLTLAGASDAVEQRYAPYLRSPSVSLSPTTLRPLQVGVVGAVERPGTYTVPVQGNGAITFPRLTDALRLAGGVSSEADIRDIEVYRPDRFGQAQVLRVNLLSLLQEGNMASDVVLRSGDTINIPVATALSPAEAAQIGEANFSPEAVTVYVVGEVDRPGPVQVTPNTPLNQVLLAAGGFDTRRADNDAVGLIRLNADGSVEERSVAIDLSDGANEETNPLLREDDVIIVDRSGLATFSDTVGLAVNPIGRLLGTIFNIFNFLD